MDSMIVEVGSTCKAVVLFNETGTERIKANIKSLDLITVECETLQECVEEASKLAEQGDIVLFSPAFASFGKYFKNEFDRGDQFNDAVRKI